jgi:hypothetical protein
MKVYVLYRPQSDHARRTEEFVHDFQARHNVKLKVIDVDSRDGIATAGLYDIMMYPAVLATTDDGQVLRAWSGDEVPPLMNELAAYVLN